MGKLLTLKVPLLLDAVERKKWDHALAVAKHWHGAQVRKYTGEPYWHHVVDVAVLVSGVADRTMDMVQAALLHDTLEDTQYAAKDLFWEFGETVGTYVVWLTNPPLSAGNRAARKRMEVNKLSGAVPAIKTIKLADILSNTASIVEHDKAFAPCYIEEKIDLLRGLVGGDTALFTRVAAQLEAGLDAIGKAKSA